MKNIRPVVLSGGSGTRLWPLSRSQRPKQFIPLIGDKSLYAQTLERVGSRYGFLPPMIIANDAHRFIMQEQAEEVAVKLDKLVLEPFGRSTAPAVIAAAIEASADDLLLFLPADHLILDLPGFHTAVDKAAILADQGKFVCFGMAPTSPETGYGYINAGDGLDVDGSFSVKEFVEKPDKATAESYLEAGTYSWNSGMFLFKASSILAEFERLQPKMLAAVKVAYDKSIKDLDFIRLDADAFEKVPSDSIDYALMEKTDKAAVVQANFGWSDMGSYSSLWEVEEKDEQRNAAIGDVSLVDSENCYVKSTSGHVSVLGVKDLVIIETGDVTMVASKDHDQDVKLLVNKLREAGRAEADVNPQVYRPWGNYKSLAEGDRFQVKEIIVKPGHRLSLQSHNHRAEHWVIVSGTGLVTKDKEQFLLREDESIYLPLGCTHRLENPGKIPLKLIEVQSGAYLGEDDIIRYEDDFGRIE